MKKIYKGANTNYQGLEKVLMTKNKIVVLLGTQHQVKIYQGINPKVGYLLGIKSIFKSFFHFFL